MGEVDLNGDQGVSIFDFDAFVVNFGVGVVYAPPLRGLELRVGETVSENAGGEQSADAVLQDVALNQLLFEWNKD